MSYFLIASGLRRYISSRAKLRALPKGAAASRPSPFAAWVVAKRTRRSFRYDNEAAQVAHSKARITLLYRSVKLRHALSKPDEEITTLGSCKEHLVVAPKVMDEDEGLSRRGTLSWRSWFLGSRLDAHTL